MKNKLILSLIITLILSLCLFVNGCLEDSTSTSTINEINYGYGANE